VKVSGKVAVGVLALAVILTLVGIGVILGTPNTQTDAQAACNPAGLTKSWSGEFKVLSVGGYGCEGNWAYVWATIGDKQHSFSVTELEQFQPLGWLMVNRATYCPTSIVPKKIRTLGCNSN